MKNRKGLKVIGIFFAVMLLLTIVVRTSQYHLLPQVETEQPRRGKILWENISEAQLVADSHTLVWAEVGLRVEEVLVVPGQHIEQNEPLVAFVPEQIDKLLANIQVQRYLLNIEKAQLISPDMRKTVKSQVDKLYDLRLEALDLEKQLYEDIKQANYCICSSDSGYVLEVKIEPGEVTDEAAIIIMMPDKSKKFLCTEIPYLLAQRLNIGDLIDVVTETGDILRLPIVSKYSHTTSILDEVRLELDKSDYLPGQVFTIDISRPSGTYPLTVPQSALHNDEKGDFILVLREYKSVLGNQLKAERLSVKVLDQDSERAAVKGNLKVEDEVITVWDKMPLPGDRVRIAER